MARFPSLYPLLLASLVLCARTHAEDATLDTTLEGEQPAGGPPNGLFLPATSGTHAPSGQPPTLPTDFPLSNLLSDLPSALPSNLPARLPSGFALPALSAPAGAAPPGDTPLHDGPALNARKASTKPKSTAKAKTTAVKTTATKTSKAAKTSADATSSKAAKTSADATSSKASKTSAAASTSADATTKATSKGSTASATDSAEPTSTSSAACSIKRAGTAGVQARAGCSTCDPCDDACDSNVSEVSTRRRALEAAAAAHGVRVVRVLAGRANPVLQFDCTAIPEVCQNMCYGVFCRGHPQTLTKSTGNKKTCAAARRQNACGASPNRCSAKKGAARGQSCDEYPFASTREGQAAGTRGRTSAVTRCVPAGQNSSQGGKISGLYRSLADGAQFDVDFHFGRGAASGYCSAATKATRAGCGTLTGTQQNS